MSASNAVSSIPGGKMLNLRRPLIMSGAMGALGLLATGLLGHILMGVFGCLGLALGLLNTRLVQRSVSRATITENPNKRALAFAAVGRLAVITVLAVGIGLLVRPDGLGVFVGLAVFQFIITASTAGTVVKELRQQ
ncbi:hypothetical protein [Amycolatopsis taiwanensis]|uniref:ATP synthase subunit I n=1 Tax=Amycolatopsis taiwanensis TaxID=342230 RepID=A0A9W6QWD1_9PSEU|nr:hypothetical protein [Amycolatopsis taiwanensis]GLY65246.1 hypothetical protein Atai01_18650 [Amycolatopsis taiwanensis]